MNLNTKQIGLKTLILQEDSLKMYYAIELYEKQDLTVRDIEDHIFKEIIEELNFHKDKKIYVHRQFVAIESGKFLTAYFANEQYRNNMVAEILNISATILLSLIHI